MDNVKSDNTRQRTNSRTTYQRGLTGPGPEGAGRGDQMKTRQICITRQDMERLRALLEVYTEDTDQLEEMLDRAHIVLPQDVPRNVVTMNSTVRIQDVGTGEERTFTLVFPGNRTDHSAVSILAPAGTALIGRREKEIVERRVPAGRKKMQILEVVYQPEREGKYEV